MRLRVVDSRGLTVLEVLIALSLVAVAALALLAVFTSGTKMMQQSTDLTMATDVGREFLESVKFDKYDSLSLGHYDGRLPDPVNGVTKFPRAPYPSTKRGNQTYELVVDVSQETPLTRLVKVEVVWNNTHRATLATLVHL